MNWNPLVRVTRFAFLFAVAASPVPAQESDRVWFGAVADVPAEFDATPLAKAAHEALATGAPLQLPPALAEDQNGRIVFLSVSRGLDRARVGLGSGLGWQAALQEAANAVQPRLDTPEPGTEAALWLKLDVVRGVSDPALLLPDETFVIDRSLQGLAMIESTGLAFLPEELVTNTLFNSDAVFRTRNVKKYFRRGGRGTPAPSLPDEWPQTARTFETISAFSDGSNTFPMYRAHRRNPDTSPEALLAAAREAGDYLRRAVKDDGEFVYSYLPKTDVDKEDYNMVRHAGTVYSMLELWNVTRDDALLEAAERALVYLMEFVVPWGEEEEGLLALAYGKKIKLGGIALTAVALVEHVRRTGKDEWLDEAQALCRMIAKAQKEDGEFIYQWNYPEGTERDFVSQYYPGEAILALVRLHSIDGNEQWLDVAEGGARFLIEIRDRGVETKDLLHDHWLLYALNELYRQRPEPLYLNHSMRIAQAITLGQKRNPEFPDHVGSFYSPPRSTPPATRAEGLLAAHQLAVSEERNEDAKRMRESIALCIAFQLQAQMRPERAIYLADPQRVLGGFTRSLTDYEIRIDYVQHNISALLGYYAILTAGR